MTAAGEHRAGHGSPRARSDSGNQVDPQAPRRDADGQRPRIERSDEAVSHADRLVALVEQLGVQLFRTPSDALMARIPVGKRLECVEIGGNSFKRWLRQQYYRLHGRVPRGEPLKDAIGVLEGKAMDGETHEVHVRVAGDSDSIYIDLADEHGTIVAITQAGWSFVPPYDAPRFRRPPGIEPLPKPVHGGSLDELRPFLNLTDEDAWVLVVGFLVGALHPKGPYLILVINGEKGTAKSTATRLLGLLLDPRDVPLRRPPRNERDLAIAARHGCLLSFNNISTLKAHLSDAIATIATEGGFVTRALNTDDGETRFKDRRPIILNGIPDFVVRGDLADRSIKIQLAPIPPKNRREESTIMAEFLASRPAIMGAIYDAVACALRGQTRTAFEELPRMADAARWISSAEERLCWRPGRFLSALKRSQSGGSHDVVEANVVGQAIQDFASSEGWTGSTKDLLHELERRNPARASGPEWPRTPHKLAGDLRAIASDLSAVGIQIVQRQKEDPVRRVRLWTVQRISQRGPHDA